MDISSAAKAPYRATFRVQTVGIEQVEQCANPDYELMQDFSSQYSQMAIFKVGDDVRQVDQENSSSFPCQSTRLCTGYFGSTIDAFISKYLRT